MKERKKTKKSFHFLPITRSFLFFSTFLRDCPHYQKCEVETDGEKNREDKNIEERSSLDG